MPQCSSRSARTESARTRSVGESRSVLQGARTHHRRARSERSCCRDTDSPFARAGADEFFQDSGHDGAAGRLRLSRSAGDGRLGGVSGQSGGGTHRLVGSAAGTASRHGWIVERTLRRVTSAHSPQTAPASSLCATRPRDTVTTCIARRRSPPSVSGRIEQPGLASQLGQKLAKTQRSSSCEPRGKERFP